MSYRKGENNPLKRMLTVDEVAYALHVHPSTIRKWASEGQLKSYRLGAKGNVRFKIEDVSDFSGFDSNFPAQTVGMRPQKRPLPEQEFGDRRTALKIVEHSRPVTATPPTDVNRPLEKALLGAEEKFTRIFSHSPVAFSLTRMRDNVIIEVNDSYCHFTGYSREEIIGRRVEELVIWIDLNERKKFLKTLQERGQIINEEYYFRNRDGQVHTVLLSADVINIEGEDCLLVMTLDISKRKQAEQSLKESEEKFRNLFENARDAILLADADTGILVDINPAGCKMLGLPKENVIGQPQTIIHPPELAERYRRAFREHVERGIVVSDDTILQRADGTRIPADISASVIRVGDKTYIQGVFRDMTGRLRAQQALKDSEEKFAKAFNVSANAICITSLEDGKFLEINDSYIDFTGYSREEVIGHTAAELKLWVVDDELKKLQDILNKEGKFRNMEFHSRHKSGEIRTGLGSAEIIYIGGKPCRIVVITDITQRERTETALRDSEEKFSKAFDFSANAVCITSLKESRFIEANESFMRFTGYSREEVIGHSAAELNLWVKPDEFKRWMDALQRDGRVFNQEWSSRMKSGEVRIGLASAEVINIGGEPCRIVVITDITERKKAEETLRFSDAAFKSIHECVFAVDNEDNVTYWNSMSEQVFGVKASEALGKSLNSIIQPVEQYRGHIQEFQEKLKEQGFNRGEMLYNTLHTKVWVDMTVRAIEKDGTQYGYVMTASDISERKRMEQELGAYRTHLEEIVNKRTAELSAVNQKLEGELEERKRIALELVKARDAAEGANRTKGDFLARMSHEIRTPIHGVIGTLNLLLDSDLKEEQRQYAKMARASAESLLSIITDILDFSKIEAGQLALEEMDFDLQATVEDALQPMALAAHKKGLELACRVAPDVPQTLVGDANRLRQVLINLLGNGVKFTEHGEVSASISLETITDDQVELHFVVSDTGMGISKDKQELLFSPFVQGNGSKYGGTGLGLAICRQLVKMMEGRIWVESEPGKGSLFRFTAKFKKSTAPARSAPVPEALERFKGTPVLVVDDNATSRLILTEILNSWGLASTGVENVSDTLDALAKIKEASNGAPLILIDMTMPVSNGLNLARKIGEDPDLKKRIIMMLPCDNISDDFSRCQEAGIPVHLVKPIRKREFQDAVIGVLNAGAENAWKAAYATPMEIPQLKLKILVAEDNPTSQIIARKTLEKMGCSVQIAGNGVEATRMAQQGDFDLVLMDFEMPEMNGLEATSVIRQKEKQTRRHLPIVAMTAYAMKQDRDKCLAAGMDGYLTKPVSPENLYNAIKGLPQFQMKAAAEQPAVDLDAALRTVGGDKAILKEVLQVFLEEDSPRLLKNIREGIERQDAKVVKAEAHGMKGASSAMGGKSVAATAARLETAALNGDMAAAWAILDEIAKELDRLKEFYAHVDLDAKGGNP
jgi:two-component system sensor histidine kinase/response regulator